MASKVSAVSVATATSSATTMQLLVLTISRSWWCQLDCLVDNALQKNHKAAMNKHPYSVHVILHIV